MSAFTVGVVMVAVLADVDLFVHNDVLNPHPDDHVVPTCRCFLEDSSARQHPDQLQDRTHIKIRTATQEPSPNIQQ